MRMYIMRPDEFGVNWFVCANSPEEAFDCIIKQIKDENDKSKEFYGDDYESNDYQEFKNSTLKNLPDGCSLIEYEPGKVIGIEFS